MPSYRPTKSVKGEYGEERRSLLAELFIAVAHQSLDLGLCRRGEADLGRRRHPPKANGSF